MTAERLQIIIDTKSQRLEKNKKRYLTLKKEVSDYEQVERHLKLQMTTKIEAVKKQIEPLVNSSLKSIFTDELLTFEIKTELFRGKVSYNVAILNHKEKIKGTIESFGGGVSAVVSVILRILFIILSNKPRFMFLDETINQVSEKYRPQVAEFLQKICNELNFQINVITFDEGGLFGEYADTIYEVQLDKNSNSIYKKLK